MTAQKVLSQSPPVLKSPGHPLPGRPPTGLFPDPSLPEAGGVQGQSSRSTARGEGVPLGTGVKPGYRKVWGGVYVLCSFCSALQRQAQCGQLETPAGKASSSVPVSTL